MFISRILFELEVALTTTNRAPYVRPRVVVLLNHCGQSEAVYTQTSQLFPTFPTAYKDLQSREDTRNGAWQQEGWDEVVYYTGIEEFCRLL